MAYEDFKNDYTEVDPGTYINADTSDDRADFVAMPLNIDAYFYKDFGASHFGNFEHDIDFYLDAADGTNDSVCGYSVGTTYDDFAGQSDSFQVFWLAKSNGQSITIQDISAGSGVNTDEYDAPGSMLDTYYYLTCTRSGTTWTVDIYSDSARTNNLDTIAVTGTSTAFRYILAGQSDNEAGGDRSITGWMEKLNLQEGAGPSGQLISIITAKMLMPLFWLRQGKNSRRDFIKNSILTILGMK